MWCPPTPPVDDSDVYIDHALCFLYEPTIMSEAQLPPVYIKKERKRTRVESISEGKRFCFGKSKLPVTMWLSISQRSLLGQSHYKNGVLKLAGLWKYPKIRLRSESISISSNLTYTKSFFFCSSFIVHVNVGHYLTTSLSRLFQHVSVSKTRPTHCFRRMTKNKKFRKFSRVLTYLL